MMTARVTSTPPAEQVCECGHKRALHSHYRPGSDCALCSLRECSRFTAATGLTISWPRAFAAAVPIIIGIVVLSIGLAMMRDLT